MGAQDQTATDSEEDRAAISALKESGVDDVDDQGKGLLVAIFVGIPLLVGAIVLIRRWSQNRDQESKISLQSALSGKRSTPTEKR